MAAALPGGTSPLASAFTLFPHMQRNVELAASATTSRRMHNQLQPNGGARKKRRAAPGPGPLNDDAAVVTERGSDAANSREPSTGAFAQLPAVRSVEDILATANNRVRKTVHPDKSISSTV